MKITTIKYEKLFNLGNYQNEKIGVEIAIGEGDDPVKCHMEAVNYVEHAHRFQTEYPKYERAKEIVNDPNNFTGYQVRQAAELITSFESQYAQFLNAAGQPTIAIPAPADDQYGY